MLTRRPKADDSDFGALDRQPRVFVSTWPDWDALARDWAALALPKAVPTAAIRALAARLAVGSADRREEATRIYDWVSAHIRYVALYQAAGALVPTAAGTVLARGWGDCKDHVALFNALLASPRHRCRYGDGQSRRLADTEQRANLPSSTT